MNSLGFQSLFLLIGLAVACSEGKVKLNNRETTQLTEDLVQTYGPVYGETGLATALPGYTENALGDQHNSLTLEEIEADPERPAFTYQPPFPANETAFSPPQAISGSYLALDSGLTSEHFCGALTYQSTVPVFRELPKTQGVYLFCIKITLKNKEIIHFVTPPIRIIDHAEAVPEFLDLATVSGRLFYQTNQVHLKFTATNASQLYVTNSPGCTDGGTWQAFNASLAWTLAEANAQNTIYAKLKSPSGRESDCKAVSMTHDNIAPQNTAVLINSGATHTASLEVTLTLSATGASEAYLSNSPACGAGGEWQNFAANLAWTLGQANALATVYAKFRDQAGNESPCVAASITHDNQAPTSASITISAGAAYTTSASVTLGLAASNATEMYITNTFGCGSGGSWEPYATTKVGWVLAQTNTMASVYSKYRNATLNETNCLSDSIVHDAIAPSDPTSFDDGSAASASVSPTCTWGASSDSGSGLAGYEIAIGTTPRGSDIKDWTAVGNVSAAIISALSLTTNTSYYASIRALDQAGNTSAVVTGDGFTYTMVWQQQAYIKATNSKSGNRFGESLAADGETVAVGSHYEDSNQTTITNGSTASSNNTANLAGAVWVYKRSASAWAQQAYLKAASADSNDQFGRKISLSADTLVVGAHGEASDQTTITNATTASINNSNVLSGAAYVYARTAGSWAQQAYLKASNAEAHDEFGSDVAIAGDTLVVSAAKESSTQTTITNGTMASADNSLSASGAVYVYSRSATNWVQDAYIKAANADTVDDFGNALSIFGDTIAVGARYENSSQTTITNGTTASIDNSLNDSGAVYIYQRSAGAWAQQAYIKAANSTATDYFGYRLALASDTLAVGAYNQDSNVTTITNASTADADKSSSDSGAVYIYKRLASNWAQESYIKAVNNNAGDNFGYRVSLNADRLAVSAYKEDSNQTTITTGNMASSDNTTTDSGAVYLYQRSASTWSQEAYFKAVNNDAADNFGMAVALSNNTLAVAASMEDSNVATITNGPTASSDNSLSNAGAVYIYTFE